MSLSTTEGLLAATRPISWKSIPSDGLGDVATSTTPSVLMDDLTGNSTRFRSRVLYVYNRDATNDIALLFVAPGASMSGLTVSDGWRIPALQWRQVIVEGDTRVGVVAAAGTPSINILVSDR